MATSTLCSQGCNKPPNNVNVAQAVHKWCHLHITYKADAQLTAESLCRSAQGQGLVMHLGQRQVSNGQMPKGSKVDTPHLAGAFC